jgi:hypothetical protein
MVRVNVLGLNRPAPRALPARPDRPLGLGRARRRRGERFQSRTPRCNVLGLLPARWSGRTRKLLRQGCLHGGRAGPSAFPRWSVRRAPLTGALTATAK